MKVFKTLIEIQSNGLELWLALVYEGDKVIDCDIFHSKEEAQAHIAGLIGE